MHILFWPIVGAILWGDKPGLFINDLFQKHLTRYTIGYTTTCAQCWQKCFTVFTAPAIPGISIEYTFYRWFPVFSLCKGEIGKAKLARCSPAVPRASWMSYHPHYTAWSSLHYQLQAKRHKLATGDTHTWVIFFEDLGHSFITMRCFTSTTPQSSISY